MDREEILDKILRNGSLTAQQQAWWEENRDRKEIQDELTLLREMEEPLRIENRKLLKSHLGKIEKIVVEPSTSLKRPATKRIFLRRWLAAAAAVSLLIVAGTFLIINQESNEFAAYFDPYPSIISPVMKGVLEDRQPSDLAMLAYQNQNYQEAINYFEDLESPNDTILFYHANACLALEDFPSALSILQNLTIQGNRFSREAAWFRSLAFFGQGQNDESISILEDIIRDPAHPYFKEADLLLKKIK